MKEMDDISEGIGAPDWILTLLLLLSWVLTFLVSVKGVKSSGKASYFLALFPYVIMVTLLIRAATLEGAADGMFYFIDTKWERLLDADVSKNLNHFQKRMIIFGYDFSCPLCNTIHLIYTIIKFGLKIRMNI